LITVVDSDSAAKDAYVKANSEVSGQQWGAGTVLLQHHLTLEENSLGCATVDLLGLTDHDCMIFQVVEHNQLPDSVILQPALHDALLEITEKS
jgi:hypothetical protein